MMTEKALVQQIVALLAEQDDILAVYLFGSQAQGKAHRASDVDIAILFVETLTAAQIFERSVALGTLLESSLPLPLDLIALNRASTLLRFQVLKNGKLVLEKDRAARCLFQMHTMSAYYDAKPYFDYQRTQMMRRIQEQEFGHGYHGYRNTLAEVRKLRQTLASTADRTA